MIIHMIMVNTYRKVNHHHHHICLGISNDCFTIVLPCLLFTLSIGTPSKECGGPFRLRHPRDAVVIT